MSVQVRAYGGLVTSRIRVLSNLVRGENRNGIVFGFVFFSRVFAIVAELGVLAVIDMNAFVILRSF